MALLSLLPHSRCVLPHSRSLSDRGGLFWHLAAPAIDIGDATQAQGLAEVFALPDEAIVAAVAHQLVLHLPVSYVLQHVHLCV